MRLQRRRWHRHRYLLTEGPGVPTPFDTWITESMARDDLNPFDRQATHPRQNRRAQTSKAKVLIAEDDRDTREVLAFYLDSLGYEVMTAPHGSTAISLAQQRRPDILLTDINMPNVDGLELIRRLRADRVLGRVPILAMTAYGTERAEKAMAMGADACLAKPLDFANLAQMIEGMLS